MCITENGANADIVPPAVKHAKHKGPYPSSFACAVIINRPAEELDAFWRDFTNLPQIMEDIESVTCSDSRHSHWVVKTLTAQQSEMQRLRRPSQPTHLLGLPP